MVVFTRNISPKCNSVLMNIHAVALVHSQDLKKCGFRFFDKAEAFLNKIQCQEDMLAQYIFSHTSDNYAVGWRRSSG